MDELTLKKLNEAADKIIENEKNSALDSELCYYMMKKMKNLQPLKNSQKSVEILLTREETLKRVLDFYKNVDLEYYSIALDLLLQLKRKNKLVIFYKDKRNLSSSEKKAANGNGLNEYYDLDDSTYIYIPVRTLEKKKIITCNEKTDIIEYSRGIVHEIAHKFDTNRSERIFSMVANIKEENIYKSKEIDKIEQIRQENKRIRTVFAETTAILFERLYLQYLIEKTDYPRSCIKSLIINRINNSLSATYICYDSLRVANIKKEKDNITEKDLFIDAKKHKESKNKTEDRFKEVIKRNGRINIAKGYAIAGLFVPTLMERYQEDGTEVLKKYIEAVKDNSIDQIFDVLNIEKSQKGIDILFENLKKDIDQNYIETDKISNIDLER